MSSEPRERHVVVEAGARDPALMAQYQQAADRGDCIFCPDHIAKYHTAPTLREGTIFFVTPSQPPRKEELGENGIHLLIIPKHHAEWLGDLPKGWMSELAGHLRWAEAEYRLRSYAVAVRVGAAAHNGAGIEHMHFHVMMGVDGQGYPFKVYDPSRVHLSKGKTNPYHAYDPSEFESQFWAVEEKRSDLKVETYVRSKDEERDMFVLTEHELDDLERLLLLVEMTSPVSSYAVVWHSGLPGPHGATEGYLVFQVLEGNTDNPAASKVYVNVYNPNWNKD